MGRLLHLDLKREATSRHMYYYGLYSEFDPSDVKRAEELLSISFYDLQCFISNQVAELFGRDLQYSLYDVTNFYTEKDYAYPNEENADRSKKPAIYPALGLKNVSKDPCLTPVMQMGLVIDENGVPVCMDIYRTSKIDTDTFIEKINEIKKEYGMKQAIVISDNDAICSYNADLLCSQGDGYIFFRPLQGEA